MSYKKKNIIFILAIILLFYFIGIMSYIIDPYNVKVAQTTENLLLCKFPRDTYYSILKLSRNNKFPTLVLGGSSNVMFNAGYPKKRVAIISIALIKTPNLIKLMNDFLDMHPETKTVVIPMDYLALICQTEEKFPLANSESQKVSFYEYYKLYFSLSAITRMFEKVTTNIKNTYLYKYFPESPYFQYSPTRYCFYFKDEINNYSKQVAMDDLNSLIDALQKRKVKIIFFTYPYQANALADIYQMGYMDLFDEAKKLIVDKVGYMYDMAFINKATSVQLDENNFVYLDVVHPDTFFGGILFEHLWGEKQWDNYIVKLTPQNIDTNLKKQRKLLDNYIRTHSKEFEEYKSTEKYVKTQYYEQKKYNDKKNMEKEIKKLIN